MFATLFRDNASPFDAVSRSLLSAALPMAITFISREVH
jgi:hypothetical protein